MENKKSGHISEQELDSLLNEAFLNLDFESNSKNKTVLTIVTKKAMRHNSLFAYFQARRHLLFLLLSFFICLNSFYRYIDPSLNKENKNLNPGTETKITEEKALLVEPKKDHFLKKANEPLVKKRLSSPEVSTIHSTKKRPDYPDKNHNEKNIPAVFTEKSIMDTTSKPAVAVSGVGSVDSPPNRSSVDSLSSVSQEKVSTSPLFLNKTATRPLKKIKPVKPQTKTKVAKRRKGKRFMGNGTFKMKNRKYGKSR